ncbi:MAG: CXXX repeat peptide maturase, partial [Bacteroidaceae bacterium]|nr:CXXX repeat peptide maturase [Bacteroidaceae bacterium]
MLQYLIILLDETSTSFCHYENANQERKLMPLDVLKEGVRFGMMENLMIQFVYPDYELPQAYQEVVESIDHSKIKPYGQEDADVLIVNGFQKVKADVPVVLRITKQELFVHQEEIAVMLGDVPRLNVVLTDVEAFAEADFETYKKVLAGLSSEVEKLYVDGKSPQLNLLTDRMMLSQMNNCGAGDTSITLAPNGKFYVCPAFYYENEADSIGDLEHGLDIKNKQLYKLGYAPICRHCDAWQCKRCVWLNRKTTL